MNSLNSWAGKSEIKSVQKMLIKMEPNCGKLSIFRVMLSCLAWLFWIHLSMLQQELGWQHPRAEILGRETIPFPSLFKDTGQKAHPVWIWWLGIAISLSQTWKCCCYKIPLVPQKAVRKQLIPISSNQQISFFIFWQFSFWRKKYVCVLGVCLNNKIRCQFSGLN